MPRLYTSSNDSLDFCRKCFPPEDIALQLYGNVGDGPDNRGNCFDYDAQHPPYQETDYHCHDCNVPLRDLDDHLTYN